jgi:transcription termination/antitermination protein NusG
MSFASENPENHLDKDLEESSGAENPMSEINDASSEGLPVANQVAASQVVASEIAAKKTEEEEPEPEIDLNQTALEALRESLDPEKKTLPWYIVHTYSGYEKQARLSLRQRIASNKLQSKFGEVLIPQETVVELVRGKKKTSSRKYFPGYILVQVHLDDETWHLLKDTPKVTGFLGDSKNPSPMSRTEIESLVGQMEGGGLKPRPKVHFEEGDAVKVIDGPFAEFNGTVDEVKPDKGKLRVLISIFGRNTPVELDFVQVEKA